MYVIYPAVDILCLSYEAAIPRFHPRPTLDNLRDPLVPLGPTRSVSTPTSNSNNQNLLATPSPKPRKNPSPNISFADDCLSSKSNQSQEEGFKTDFFNARSSSIDTSTNLLSETSAISSNNINLISNNNDPISGKKKSKIKSKLQISLGRLGRPHSHDPPPSRLRGEDLKIHVSNPTFTSDNLRANNYDAFFASGEPVYSLEKKEKLQLESEVITGSPSVYSDKTRSNSLSIFHKSNSKLTSSSSPVADKKRPKSAEILSNLAQGERCSHKKVFYT